MVQGRVDFVVASYIELLGVAVVMAILARRAARCSSSSRWP